MAHAHQHTAHGTLITAPFRSLRQVIECEKYGKHGKSENFLGTKNWRNHWNHYKVWKIQVATAVSGCWSMECSPHGLNLNLRIRTDEKIWQVENWNVTFSQRAPAIDLEREVVATSWHEDANSYNDTPRIGWIGMSACFCFVSVFPLSLLRQVSLVELGSGTLKYKVSLSSASSTIVRLALPVNLPK